MEVSTFFPHHVFFYHSRQKCQMQKQNGGKEVDERQLFHGTSANFVDAICQQNFDWRVCGLHGTSYGKGKVGVLPTVVGKLFENSLTEATVGANQSMLPVRNGSTLSWQYFGYCSTCVTKSSVNLRQGSPASLGLVSCRMDALRGSESWKKRATPFQPC